MLSALAPLALTFLVRFAADAFRGWQADRAARDAGRAEATAAAEAAARESAQTAREVESDANARHRADPTDGAFDPTFRRD